MRADWRCAHGNVVTHGNVLRTATSYLSNKRTKTGKDGHVAVHRCTKIYSKKYLAVRLFRVAQGDRDKLSASANVAVDHPTCISVQGIEFVKQKNQNR
jgi:hypothetical protein